MELLASIINLFIVSVFLNIVKYLLLFVRTSVNVADCMLMDV